MKNQFLVAFLALCLVGQVHAQKDETLFNKLKITGAWGGATTNFTTAGDDNLVLSGGFGGLEFAKDYFIGFGGVSTVGDFFLDDLSSDRYQMNYNGLILGYAPSAYKLVHLQGSLLLGAGDVRNRDSLEEDQFIVVKPSIGAEINVVRWFRIGVSGGYRALFDTDLSAASNGELSRAFGQISFKFGWSWGR